MITVRNYAVSLAKEDFRPKLDKLLSNPLPTRVKQFVKEVGRGINQLEMIKDNDAVIIGISGGKDSLALALSLALRKKWLPVSYRLEAVQILWKEYPLTERQHKDFEDYFGMLGIPYKVLEASMFAPDTKGKRFSCYICSRNRKRILFNYAEEQNTFKVALGHHKDDIIQTTLMNMAYQGTLAAMMPRQQFFGGKFEIIRPMALCFEEQIIRIAEEFALPVVSIGCPYRDDSARMDMKPIVAALEKINKGSKENMYKALFNIKTEYLPGCVYRQREREE
jgi:tRNA 2-thiocytidine biosynthesis protein TtcA